MLQTVQKKSQTWRDPVEGRNNCQLSRQEDNIKIDLKEVGWMKGMDWINLAQDTDK